MHILLFGSLKEKLKTEMLELSAAQSVFVLKEKLELTFPLLKNEHYSIAVNKKICTDDSQTLNEGDIIALLPPFSGG